MSEISLQFSSELDEEEGGVMRMGMEEEGGNSMMMLGDVDDGVGGLDRMYELMETARVSDQHALHVPIIGLTRIPSRIGRLSELEELYIKSNLITSLPSSIQYLSNLRVLELQQNNLVSLPPEIGELKALSTLDVSWNKLELLPRSVGKCSQLKVLVVSHNKLTSLPQEIGFLLDLEVLLADDNELTSLPPSFGYLQQLRMFSVSENRLRCLIPEIGLLTQCESYDISRNPMVGSVSLPLWFLGEPVPALSAWATDGVVLALALALFVTGGVVGRTEARSGGAIVMLVLTLVLILVMILVVGFASMRVGMPSFTPSPRLRSSRTNAAALFTLVWEMIQLVAMCVRGVRWPSAVNTTVRTALLDVTALFSFLFWVSVVLGMALRMALEFPRLQSALKSVGLPVTLNLSSYLAFASALFYLPILNNALGALSCSYDVADPSAPHSLVLHRSPGHECWSKEHFAYAVGAIGVLMVYYPMAVLSNPIWQERNLGLDVRFHPSYLLLVGQGKMVLSVVTNFTRDINARLCILLVSFVGMAVYTLWSRPSSSVLDKWRSGGFFVAASTASVALWITGDRGVGLGTAFGVLGGVWAGVGVVLVGWTVWVWRREVAAIGRTH